MDKENDDKEMRGRLREFLQSKRPAASNNGARVIKGPVSVANRPFSTTKPMIQKTKISSTPKRPLPPLQIESTILPLISFQKRPCPATHIPDTGSKKILADSCKEINNCRRKLLYAQLCDNPDFNPIPAQKLEFIKDLTEAQIRTRRQSGRDLRIRLGELLLELESRSSLLQRYATQVLVSRQPIIQDGEFCGIMVGMREVKETVQECLEMANHFEELTDLKQLLPSLLNGLTAKYALVDATCNYLLLSSI
jgi:hypothetical protein